MGGKRKIYCIEGEFNGNLLEASVRYKIPYKTLWSRINVMGLSFEEAIRKSSGRSTSKSLKSFGYKHRLSESKTYTVKGFTGTLHEVADHFHINFHTLVSRMRSGWDFEDAVSIPVNKSMGAKIPTIFAVGNFKGSFQDIRCRFGHELDNKDSSAYVADFDHLVIDVLNKPFAVKFHSVGKYRGTCSAIARDFHVSRKALLQCERDGKSVEAYVRSCYISFHKDLDQAIEKVLNGESI